MSPRFQPQKFCFGLSEIYFFKVCPRNSEVPSKLRQMTWLGLEVTSFQPVPLGSGSGFSPREGLQGQAKVPLKQTVGAYLPAALSASVLPVITSAGGAQWMMDGLMNANWLDRGSTAPDPASVSWAFRPLQGRGVSTPT